MLFGSKGRSQKGKQRSPSRWMHESLSGGEIGNHRGNDQLGAISLIGQRRMAAGPNRGTSCRNPFIPQPIELGKILGIGQVNQNLHQVVNRCPQLGATGLYLLKEHRKLLSRGEGRVVGYFNEVGGVLKNDRIGPPTGYSEPFDFRHGISSTTGAATKNPP